ncbi:putative 20S proteasome subunit beta 7, partial [Toxoplasma gondii ARI]
GLRALREEDDGHGFGGLRLV